MAGRRRKIKKKKHQLKHPKAVPQNLDQNINDSISHICNSFFENLISGKQLFLYSSTCSNRYQQNFFYSFLVESFKANKDQRKRSLVLQYSFAQKTSRTLQTSTHFTLKIICSRKTAKNLSHFTNSLANMFLFGVRKTICTAPFLAARELHS